jgi:hypothetical protein
MHAHGLQHLSRSRVFLRATPLHAEKYARVICLQALPLPAMRVLISTESRDTSAHAVWIWLETDDQLNRYACFFTPSTNQMPSSSQHVDAKCVLFISKNLDFRNVHRHLLLLLYLYK